MDATDIMTTVIMVAILLIFLYDKDTVE